MEKTTKKKKSKKGLRKRIGIIAVGGLSLVLTVCLSVGATLAWFAGSTWASKSLYMGGPVYVEMAGRGTQTGDGSGTAKWLGGDGNLDIKAAAGRTTGTVAADGISDDILLPGQKVEIYSQARVYSTAETNTVDDNRIPNTSTGANTSNSGNSGSGSVTYQDSTGRVTTTTTSVLRARFSIEIEFDPGMGYNNFTNTDYQENYPVQSGKYKGTNATDTTNGDTWQSALGAAAFKYTNVSNPDYVAGSDDEGKKNPTIQTTVGRRDAVLNSDGKFVNATEGEGATKTNLDGIKAGTKTSIYKWKFVSASEYYRAGKTLTSNTDNNTSSGASADGHAKYGIRMGAPFDGSEKTAGGYGFYGVWITSEISTGTYANVESDSFYKARCNSYIQSYVEMYVNEYGGTVTRTIGDSIKALESDLNDSFVDLINDSSEKIHNGHVTGNTVNSGIITDNDATDKINASWLYIDPTIGNDTNTDEISTSVGGWWYLVEDNGKSLTDSDYAITNQKDSVTLTKEDGSVTASATTNTPAADGSLTITRADGAKDDKRLFAKLYEIKPDLKTSTTVSKNGTVEVKKVVSDAFPFVNGTFALPSDALTNVFANAKITFKIAFQAVQAFFPYTESIDGIDYTNPLLGTAKALNIQNAIFVFNEAFDYSESLSTNTNSKL